LALTRGLARLTRIRARVSIIADTVAIRINKGVRRLFACSGISGITNQGNDSDSHHYQGGAFLRFCEHVQPFVCRPCKSLARASRGRPYRVELTSPHQQVLCQRFPVTNRPQPCKSGALGDPTLQNLQAQCKPLILNARFARQMSGAPCKNHFKPLWHGDC